MPSASDVRPAWRRSTVLEMPSVAHHMRPTALHTHGTVVSTPSSSW